MPAKSYLRSEIKPILSSMSSEMISRKSKKIMKNLEALDEFRNANSLMIYMPIAYEVDTSYILEKYSMSKTIFIPRVCTRAIIEITQYQDGRRLQKNAWGILEDTKSPAFTALENIDLIIVPGLAFDCDGNRLGRGMGCYDRFLRHADSACKVGLAFTAQIIKSVPTEDHDVRMDKIVSEDQVLTIR